MLLKCAECSHLEISGRSNGFQTAPDHRAASQLFRPTTKTAVLNGEEFTNCTDRRLTGELCPVCGRTERAPVRHHRTPATLPACAGCRTRAGCSHQVAARAQLHLLTTGARNPTAQAHLVRGAWVQAPAARWTGPSLISRARTAVRDTAAGAAPHGVRSRRSGQCCGCCVAAARGISGGREQQLRPTFHVPGAGAGGRGPSRI